MLPENYVSLGIHVLGLAFYMRIAHLKIFSETISYCPTVHEDPLFLQDSVLDVPWGEYTTLSKHSFLYRFFSFLKRIISDAIKLTEIWIWLHMFINCLDILADCHDRHIKQIWNDRQCKLVFDAKSFGKLDSSASSFIIAHFPFSLIYSEKVSFCNNWILFFVFQNLLIAPKIIIGEWEVNFWKVLLESLDNFCLTRILICISQKMRRNSILF